MGSKLNVAYTEEYKQKCFQAWYAAGRPSRGIRIMEVIPVEEEYNRKPNKAVLASWRREMNWDILADEMDAKAMELATDHLIVQKAEMLKRQADEGFELQANGMKYLKEFGFDSSASAVNAIVRGVQIERESKGMSEFVLKLAKMSDADVKAEILRLTSKTDTTDVIDADEVTVKEDKTEVDTESNSLEDEHEYDLPEN